MNNTTNSDSSKKKTGWLFEKDENHPNPIGRLPRWQQWIVFIVLVVAAVLAKDYITEAIRGSDESVKMKKVLVPLAEQLEVAEKTGDRQSVIALFKPTTDVLNAYNQLPQEKIDKINQSSLRYCVLAAVHLSQGTREVYDTGYWASRTQYQNALDMCK